MNRFLRRLIRPSAFLRAEIFEILRQPRLVLVLVLGPFLILLLFGLGYRNVARSLRTLFVAPAGSPMAKQIGDFAKNLGPQLVYMGVGDDEAAAKDRLRRGEVDLVAVAPPNPYEAVRNNQQALFRLYHNEIDPLQSDYVKYFAQVYFDEINRRVVRTVVAQAQGDATRLQQDLKAAHASAAGMREALQRGDAVAARLQQRTLDQNVSAIELAAGATLALFGGLGQVVGPESGAPAAADPAALQSKLDDLRKRTDAFGTIPDKKDYSAETKSVSEIENDLGLLDSKLGNLQQISPDVLLSPFKFETQGVAAVQARITDYFAPAVIVLLLQHLAITFAALSIVRERRLGTMELFRVSPISTTETLLGKYVSYLIFGSLLAVLLTLLLYFGLRIPMLGAWENYALVVGALLFTALGYGFVISLISQTETQAVQYTMLLLLMSVFFSGFFLNLDALIEPVRVISWALPATYGIVLLQNIMLRGFVPAPLLLGGLAGIGVVLFFAALLLLRRQMERR